MSEIRGKHWMRNYHWRAYHLRREHARFGYNPHVEIRLGWLIAHLQRRLSKMQRKYARLHREVKHLRTLLDQRKERS